MTGHLKKFIFITVTAVVIAFLLGPPLAIASNLPTVCNFFHKTGDKAAPCGHRAMISKIHDKSFQVEAVLSLDVDFETSYFLIIQSNPLSISFPLGSNTQFNPLRC
jgi:hypothetical protein